MGASLVRFPAGRFPYRHDLGPGLSRVLRTSGPRRPPIRWIDVNQKPIGGLIPSAEVAAALALVDFHADTWTVWRVDPSLSTPGGPSTSPLSDQLRDRSPE